MDIVLYAYDSDDDEDDDDTYNDLCAFAFSR